MKEPLCHGPGASTESAHEMMKADNSLWTSLAFNEIQHDGRGNLIECRRCPRCGSTLFRPLSMRSALEVYGQQTAMQSRSKAALEAARRLLGIPIRDIKDAAWLQQSDESALEKDQLSPIQGPEPDTRPVNGDSEQSEPHPPQSLEKDWPRTVKEFGLALRQTREFAGLTRVQLAELSDVAASTIRNVETHRHAVTSSVRRRLIRALTLRGYPSPTGWGNS